MTAAERVVLYQAKVTWWIGVLEIKGDVAAETLDPESIARKASLAKLGEAIADYEIECRELK